MAETEPDSSGEVFCDTSVLLNYVLDQGDEGARILLTESKRHTVISEKVKTEFERVPERREDIYLDFMRIIPLEDSSIENLSISDRDYLKPNDEAFFIRLKEEVTQGDTAKERLQRLREKQKIIDRRYGQTREIIQKVCEQNDDLGLIFQLGSVIENDDDCQVVSDAVQWTATGGSGMFATLDVGDLISHSDNINKIVEEYHGGEATLDIGEPGSFIDDDH